MKGGAMATTKAQAAELLTGQGFKRASTTESKKGAPGSFVGIETWQRGASFAAIMTQYLAGKESFSRILREVAE
jgi:hypothetical protein